MRAIVLLALTALLAGCSESALIEEDPTFDDLDLEATDSTGIIRGVVIDGTITPIEGATIAIVGNGASTTSDADGAFGFDGLEPGTYFLDVSRPGYASVQQSADVVAGVAQPPIVKVLLEFQPGTLPQFIPLSQSGLIACSAATLLTVHPICNDANLQDDRSKLPFDIATTPDWFQSEILWDSTQPLGTNLYQINYVYDEGGYTGDRIGEGIGESPRVFGYGIEQTTAVGLGPNGVEVSLFSGGPVLETGVALDQKFDAFVSLFYNFTPPEGWTFHADGHPQLPS